MMRMCRWARNQRTGKELIGWGNSGDRAGLMWLMEGSCRGKIRELAVLQEPSRGDNRAGKWGDHSMLSAATLWKQAYQTAPGRKNRKHVSRQKKFLFLVDERSLKIGCDEPLTWILSDENFFLLLMSGLKGYKCWRNGCKSWLSDQIQKGRESPLFLSLLFTVPANPNELFFGSYGLFLINFTTWIPIWPCTACPYWQC